MTALFWTPDAMRDREAIYDLIELDNPGAALTLDELFEVKAGHLIDHPSLVAPAVSLVRASWSCIRTTYWFMTSPATGFACCVYCMRPDSGRIDSTQLRATVVAKHPILTPAAFWARHG